MPDVVPFRSVRAWRAGAVLLIAGGALHPVGAFLVPSLAVVGQLIVGAGLVLAGFGIRGRLPACWLLFVAGGAQVVLAALTAATQFAAPVPVLLFQAALLLAMAGLLAAGIALVVSGRLPGAARWILLGAAVWFVLALTVILPPLELVPMIAAGVLYLRVPTR